MPRAVVIGAPHQEESAVKLLEQVRHVARLRRLALETERCYARWVEQYIRFDKTAEGFRHPNTLGAEEIERFLTFLAVRRRVSASTRNQAFAALLFLNRGPASVLILLDRLLSAAEPHAAPVR